MSRYEHVQSSATPKQNEHFLSRCCQAHPSPSPNRPSCRCQCLWGEHRVPQSLCATAPDGRAVPPLQRRRRAARLLTFVAMQICSPAPEREGSRGGCVPSVVSGMTAQRSNLNSLNMCMRLSVPPCNKIRCAYFYSLFHLLTPPCSPLSPHHTPPPLHASPDCFAPCLITSPLVHHLIASPFAHRCRDNQ